MTKEFKKQYDVMANIKKAESLAYDLGYDEAYLDGATITSPTYSKEMRSKISNLCGTTEWPQNVIDAFYEGDRDGFMDT